MIFFVCEVRALSRMNGRRNDIVRVQYERYRGETGPRVIFNACMESCVRVQFELYRGEIGPRMMFCECMEGCVRGRKNCNPLVRAPYDLRLYGKPRSS